MIFFSSIVSYKDTFNAKEVTTTDITLEHAPVSPEFIPTTVAEETGQVALDAFLRYKHYLQKHPDKEREFQARVAEVRKRYGK